MHVGAAFGTHPMLTVAEALAAIVAEVQPLAPVAVPLDEALGLVLAENAIAELDSPPFDKALMDGYAVRSADLPEGRGRLRVIEEVLAGQVAKRTVAAGEATRIMTGAPLPPGADAVVQVEHTRPAGDGLNEIDIETGPVPPQRNVLLRGASSRAGAVIVRSGTRLRSQQLGCLAEMGKARVMVLPRPTVAVLATGDELVDVGQTPGPGQIRNSNETMLVAQLREAGVTPVPLGIARDDVDDLRRHIAEGLQHDVLLLSGGVSAGKVDLVPSVLAELGVRQVFHKVRIRPGQPLWFGVFEKGKRPSSEWLDSPQKEAPDLCRVFGLPGNPVSSMVCCELFARTAFRRLMGIEPAEPVPIAARLSGDQVCKGNRPTYHPAKLEWAAEGPRVAAVRWVGSADLSATAEANALVQFPEGEQTLPAGRLVNVYPW